MFRILTPIAALLMSTSGMVLAQQAADSPPPVATLVDTGPGP